MDNIPYSGTESSSLLLFVLQQLRMKTGTNYSDPLL